jgi:Spy/CpxP family protein refolding chaperone
MNKPRLFFILALVFVFAAGVAAGVFVERLWFAKKPDGRPSGRPPVPSHDRWAKDLGLSAEQQAKIQDIFKANDGRMRNLRSDYYKHLGEIRDELRKEIDAVLTPEQRQKQEAMVQKAREEHRRSMDRRSPPSRPRTKDNPPAKSNKERTDEEKSNPWSGDHRDRRGSHPGLHPD